MIKFENLMTAGWEPAIRGMRNAKNSWVKSDSGNGCLSRLYYDHTEKGPLLCANCSATYESHCVCTGEKQFVIGPNDHKLMMNLREAGTDHRKYLRQIMVWVDITAPLYWWKEFDTYKVGTTSNSCSTMHTIHQKEFTLEDFSCEKLFSNNDGHRMVELNACCERFGAPGFEFGPLEDLQYDIDKLNIYRQLFIQTKDKFWWEQMIQRLPSSYNQRRTISMSYENLANMYKSRKNHKLDEWRDLCKWIETDLPYLELITGKAEETT